MGLPSIIDVAHEHLFADVSIMKASGLSEPTIRHILRLRDVYNYWLQFPSKKDRDIVNELKLRGGIGDTQARQDLRLIKTLLGDLELQTTNYYRYRVIEMASRAYDKAAAMNNTRDMVAAASLIGKVTRLDKDDPAGNMYEQAAVQSFEFTDDPAVIGLSRVPNHREKIKAMKEKYFNETIVDIEAEVIEYNPDEIFKPKIDYDAPADLSE